MPSLYAQKDKNIRKTWFLFTLFFAVIIGIGWVFTQMYDSAIILYIAIIFSVLMSITSYWYSDKIVLKMANAKPIEKSNAPELYNIVENLSIASGLPMPRIYLVADPSPNAFATGRDPKHAVVAVTSGLLDILDRSELEGVLAHELSHVGNRDMLVSTVAVILVGFIAMLSDIFTRSLFWGGLGGRRNREGGGYIIVIGIALAILSPLIATLMQLAISRKREFLADASGALLTRYPDGLANALEKISRANIPIARPNNSTNHLWFSDPTKGTPKTRFLTKLFMTHPPTEKRIAALRGMEV